MICGRCRTILTPREAEIMELEKYGGTEQLT